MENKKLIKFWIGKLIEHFRVKKIEIDPIPTIVLDDTENDENNLLIKTGDYSWENQRICLYINNRHLKDIMRTFCHEMIHHHQYLDNPAYFKRIDKSGSLETNPQLNLMEMEAFTMGNKLFRSFTETFTHV